MAGQGNRRQPLVADRRYPPTRRGGGKGAGGGKSGGKGGARAARSRRAPRARRASRGPLGWIVGLVLGGLLLLWRVVWGVSWRIGLVTGLILAAAVTWYAVQLPPVGELVDGRARGSVTMLDRTGQPFAWRGEQFDVTRSEDVSPWLVNAVVATEDRRFWWHPGVDPIGILGAIRINLAEGRGPLQGNGGSTITQQTAKLLCLGRPFDPAAWESEAAYEADCRETTLWRKLQEMVFAMAMEAVYTKDEILTIYLNRAYLGGGARGFEAAAQRYFGHSAAEVSPAEAAMLAGLLQAPSTYAPTGNLARSQGRASVVVGLMEGQGYLTAAEAADARAHPAVLSQQAGSRSGGSFADWVMEQGPDFFTRDTTEDVVIETTFDPRIQRAAETALQSVFETQVSAGSEAQAAIVVMSADGAVRAMVGGRDIPASGAFNRATQALRQTGSSFKPFVYAAALENGTSPWALVDDSPLTINVPGSGPWSPRNYDGEFKGPITLVQALAESRNIPAVRVSELVGREAVAQVATMFGIDSALASGPALALGASESTLIEMSGAYAGILNGGSSVTPYGIRSLRLAHDQVPLMDQSGGIGERVIREEAARELVWMMSRVIEEGTGQRARIRGWELAGKTGTTSAARDAWFIGFSGDYVTGVWMGYDNNTPLRGVTGGGLPAEIWRQTMERVLDGMTPVPLPMTEPPGTRGGFVDPGGLAADGTGVPGAALGTTDPAVDAALREVFGPPGGGDSSAEAIDRALEEIFGPPQD
ncbi:MAG: PBP1A family penicillin-binding protein [Rubellimicrobium sp.]|nr:PBP1A family penicillin-binding protein [Rubellimicrobium sp.]